MEAVEGGPRGVLGLRAGRRSFEVTRSRPSPDLAGLVEHYWTVRWDLRGRDPHTQHTLPHPSVHLVAERDRSGIMGVLTGRFTRELEGEGRAFGVKFRPAGFHPFLGAPVSSLTDRRLAVAEVFGPAGDDLVADLLAARDLGYFDQAHFARDFRATVGRPPTAYTRPRGIGCARLRVRA